MSKNEILINYLKARAEALPKNLQTKYLTRDDIKEVQSWSEEEVENVLENLKCVIEGYHYYTTTGFLCPWCIRHVDDECEDCSYADRHNGECDEDSSDYSVFNLHPHLKLTFDRQKLLSIINGEKNNE